MDPLHPLHGAVGRCANWYLPNCSEEGGGGGTCSPGKPNWRALVCAPWPEMPLQVGKTGLQPSTRVTCVLQVGKSELQQLLAGGGSTASAAWCRRAMR
ncbi:hypothetical protein ACFPOG_15685 [Paenibacillus aestuarii]|uniref:Uncharacterized protein n=1 Tax=Paenibacillus aestuarii TaxID=516965 RepID=A0ABW0K9M3_9BACL